MLADPATACAVLFVTPEVEQSSTIREIEAPEIVGRALKNDGFFAIPVAAGGLHYDAVGPALGPKVRLANLPGWNIHRVNTDPIRAPEAHAIADRVLDQRLTAIHRDEPAGPLRIVVGTRAPLPAAAGEALTLDLTHLFTGRLAPTHAWANSILPGLQSVVKAIRLRAPARDVELTGLVAIPAAVALGAAFMSLSGVRTTWNQRQDVFGKPAKVWGLHRQREDSQFEVEARSMSIDATDLALLVSVAADVKPDFERCLDALPPLRAYVSVSPPTEPAIGNRVMLSSGQALDVAHRAIDALRAARRQHRVTGTVHLFLAVPVGLAMMIGQMLNTFGTVQCYEHVPGREPVYQPAALLAPSY